MNHDKALYWYHLIVILAFSMAVSPSCYGFNETPERIALRLEEAFVAPKTPEALAEFMQQKFRFVEDRVLFGQEDYWQSPQEFWGRRAGDCEDFALFAQYALQKNGIEAYVISVYAQENYAHTILVYREGDTYNVMSDGKLRPFRARSIEDAITKFRPDWIWASNAERREGRGWSLKQFQNPIQVQIPTASNLFSDFAF